MVMSAPGVAIETLKVCRIRRHEDSRAPLFYKPKGGRRERGSAAGGDFMTIGMLLIRADAGAGVGAGHLMRCLALAEAWIEKGGAAVVAVPTDIPDGLAARVASIGAAVERVPAGPDDAGWLIRRSNALSARWIVIDGYRFGASYLAAVSEAGVPVLVLDDDARHPAYPAQLILNQNLHARAEDYRGKFNETLLLGPSYALIRSEFREISAWERPIPAVASKVLVTLGGADPGGHTARLIDAFRLLGGGDATHKPSVRVVVGAANPRLESLRATVAELPGVEILSDVRDMGEQMRWCDLALSASGSTVWELALFGTPMLLATASKVEEPVARSMADTGAALHLGRLDDVDVERLATRLDQILGDAALRGRLRDATARLVDGQGAGRVVDQMLAISPGPA
jgi:UDP-2,4-diacetamido-2,4,6-trideoxy-beta-L-altropyranose hydrolase